MRAHDWCATPLGDPEHWPQSLRTTVRLALNTRHPIFIFWGPEHICLYNDAYRATLDDVRHPSSLGARGRDVWAEVWDIIGPQIDLVMSGRGATWHEDHLVPTTRFGRLIDVYWTYSYSPIDDESAPDGVGGVLVICNDVTEAHVNRRRLAEDIAIRKRIEDALRTSEERLGLLWDSARVLLDADDPNAMLDGVFIRIARHLEVDAYLHFIAEPSTRTLHAASYGGFSGVQAIEFGKLAFGEGVSGLAAEKRAVQVVARVQSSGDPRTERIRRYGFRAYAACPLMAGDRLIGTLAFGSRERDEFGPEELEFLRTVARYVAVAYERLQLIASLRDADRRKDEFLATLSHELRNPLAPIRQAAKVSRMANATEAQLRWSQDVIERQVQHMALLLDDLLDVSRITRGRLELRREACDLAAIVDLAVETANPSIEARGHRLSVSMPSDRTLVHADALRLAQVIANLLTNAAKYTEPGGSLQLILERAPEVLLIRVLDDGIGLEPHEIPGLFEMFSQVASAIDRAEGGLGIGLALVKGLVELHGGTVSAHSAGLGRGSEFVVRLPLEGVRRTPGPATDISKEPRMSLRKILIADDNHDAATSLGMLMELSGHEVSLAHDGEEALALAGTHRPEVVLLDIGMPKLNGYEVAERIRTEDWGRKMLLIAVTGWGQDEAQKQALRAGFDHHLTKPIDPDVIERLLAGEPHPPRG